MAKQYELRHNEKEMIQFTIQANKELEQILQADEEKQYDSEMVHIDWSYLFLVVLYFVYSKQKYLIFFQAQYPLKVPCCRKN